MFLEVNKEEKKQLKYEVISHRTRLLLTRLIRQVSEHDDDTITLIFKNKFINIARNILDKPIYVLDSPDLEYYYPVEHAWHNGELELIMKRPNTIELIETIIDYLQNKLLRYTDVNEILSNENCSFSFDTGVFGDVISIIIEPLISIDKSTMEGEHKNIRHLVKRLDLLFDDDDYSGVLHTCATIYETLAKDIIEDESIQNKTLTTFFAKYRNESMLPQPILDLILDIYRKRNSEPLAGHGSIKDSTLSKNDAIILSEMTKAFILIERKITQSELKFNDIK